jgi:hypothetical protein
MKKLSVSDMKEILARFDEGPMSAPEKKQLFEDNPEFKKMNEEYGDVVKDQYKEAGLMDSAAFADALHLAADDKEARLKDGDPVDPGQFGDAIKSGLTKLFPRSTFLAKVSGDSILVAFTVTAKSDWANGIIHNDPSYTQCWLHRALDEQGFLKPSVTVKMSMGNIVYGPNASNPINVGWRNKTGTPEQIISHFYKYFILLKRAYDQQTGLPKQANNDEKDARFEEGKPADPTVNMTEEDKKEWEQQNEEHKDEFKAASRTRMTAGQIVTAGERLFVFVAGFEPKYVLGATLDKTGKSPLFWKRQIIRSKGLWTLYFMSGVPEDLAEAMVDQGTPAMQADAQTEKKIGIILWKKLSRLPIAMKEIMVSPELASMNDVSMLPKEAAVASGLYGYTKALQNSVEASVRKIQRKAAILAKHAYGKDAKVSEFLSTHAKRANSTSARILIAAMKDLGPKFASHEKQAGKSSYGMYGFPQKTANLGLVACTSLKEEIGMIAADMHRRKADLHEQITGFLKQHSRTAKCDVSKMLLTAYPDVTIKIASKNPDSVNDWLAWQVD